MYFTTVCWLSLVRLAHTVIVSRRVLHAIVFRKICASCLKSRPLLVSELNSLGHL